MEQKVHLSQAPTGKHARFTAAAAAVVEKIGLLPVRAGERRTALHVPDSCVDHQDRDFRHDQDDLAHHQDAAEGHWVHKHLRISAALPAEAVRSGIASWHAETPYEVENLPRQTVLVQVDACIALRYDLTYLG